MLANPWEILKEFPVRKTKEQKLAFRDAVQSYAEKQGYRTVLENGALCLGQTESSKFLVTCRYDMTSAVITLLEIARTMPETQRSKVCFVLLDRNSKFSWNEKQMVLHLEDVGYGDHIRFLPTKKLKADLKRLTSLYKACGYFGKKDVLVAEKQRIFPAFRAVKFPVGVTIRTMKQGRFCLYPDKLPKGESGVDETNVNILRAALTTFICRDAVN